MRFQPGQSAFSNGTQGSGLLSFLAFLASNDLGRNCGIFKKPRNPAMLWRFFACKVNRLPQEVVSAVERPTFDEIFGELWPKVHCLGRPSRLYWSVKGSGS